METTYSGHKAKGTARVEATPAWPAAPSSTAKTGGLSCSLQPYTGLALGVGEGLELFHLYPHLQQEGIQRICRK